MEKKRLIWADSLKGWLIILVVLGHTIQNTIGGLRIKSLMESDILVPYACFYGCKWLSGI